MKVAVSGTHGSGKTTLIERFLLAHSDFAHEPEPYLVLQELYDEVFAAEPSADDFNRQLEFNLDRLQDYRRGQRVIYERCPVDFLAYLMALDDLGRDRQARHLVERAIEPVRQALAALDLILFLPLDDLMEKLIPEAEDEELRVAADERLTAILCDDELGFFSDSRARVCELRGTLAQRLRAVDSALEAAGVERSGG
jgi:hypothetical protein